jgi:hypothetical protein
MLKLSLEIKRAGLTQRAHARLMKEINRACMERQWKERVPLHFEMLAYARYGARQRSAKYNQNKLRAKYIGHIRPNVKTGYLKRSMKAKITATQYGARLIISASLNNKLPTEEWESMTKVQRDKWLQKNSRRLANWQKKEIAKLAPSEILEERKRQARDYRLGAMSTQYKRQRIRRVK